MSIVTVKQLLETGVHFGHQTSNWNPKMDPYIFTSRNKVHIIDLEKTEEKIKEAYNFVRDTVAEGKDVLFVCTKRQGNDIITEEAKRCNMYYINYRWWGGMLTNFATISKSIDRFKELEQMQEDGILDSLSKKEQSRLMKEKYRLERALIGIKDMKDLPGVLYIVDTNLEEIAVSEARKLNIPIVALVDTNCNPEVIDYIIPGNDDALRSIKLITSVISDAVLEGLDIRVRSVKEDDKSLSSSSGANRSVKEKEDDKSLSSSSGANRSVKEDDNSAKRKKNDKSLSSVSEASPSSGAKDIEKVKGKEKESEPDRPDTEVKGADGGGDDGLQEGAVKE